MSNFKPFGKAVHDRFKALSKQELFVVDIEGDELFASYLAAFPAGTNPMYKTRHEYDCSCCKNFVRNLGKVVAVVDGKMQTMWQDLGQLDHPFDIVAETLHNDIKGRKIAALFRTKEGTYGSETTTQFAGDKVLRWNHFHGKIEALHRTQEVGTAQGEYAMKVQLLRDGMMIPVPSYETILTLIEENNLYRGKEELGAIRAMRTLQTAYSKAKDKHSFLWEAAAKAPAHFSTTLMGKTLGMIETDGIEAAVKFFETNKGGANYKRPTALITPKMVEQAMETIEKEGLEPALSRRHARITDVSINNVAWVDNSVKNSMKGGLSGVLMEAAVAPKVKSEELRAEDISIEDFMSKVLPKAQTLEVLFKNGHQPRLMSITAPVAAEVPELFRWDNNFAWSYKGGMADSSMRQAVQAKGGRVDGVFRFTHQWNYRERNASLMDLHVFLPASTIKAGNPTNDAYGNSERVGWNHRNHFGTGGTQDVDYVEAAPEGYVPVENITFPDLARMPAGTYTCKIHNWSLRQPTKGGFKAEIEFAGQVFEYEHREPMKNEEWVTVAEVTLKKTKQGTEWSINHHMPHGAQSLNVWGLKTEQFVKVQTVMLSPNFWDDNSYGNKHFFFILEGCKNDESVRGFYNEYLHQRLDKHRKVFEVLAEKTKCGASDDQLSGIGFSETQKDSLTVKVKGAKLFKLYNINFGA